MDLRLQGAHVMVTGGTHGIGQAIAQGFLAEGAEVAVCSRHPAPPDLFSAEWADRWTATVVDIQDPDSVTRWVTACGAAWTHIDVIINNAGRAIPGAFEDLTTTQWLEDWTMKFLGPAHVVREALPWLRPGARIVNISAVFGKQPDPRFFASSVTRASTVAWTKALAKAWAPRDIRVNAVNIGFVRSNQWRSRSEAELRDLVEKFQVPLGRFGLPEEVVPVVLLLASPLSSYVTGAVVDVDGGLAQYL